MSVVSSTQKIPAALAGRLRALRLKLAGWIVVDGLSRLLLAAVGLVLVDALIDRMLKMDLAQRVIMLCLIAAALLAILAWRVIRPLLGRVSDDALVLQVEHHNRELRESLISSVQFSRQTDLARQGVSPHMVQATIDRGLEAARSVNFGTSLNRHQHRINLVLLAVGVLAIGTLAVGVAQTEFWRTWFNRNVLLTSDQWPQATYLMIDGAVDGQKVMKRGENHVQLVRVDSARSRITDVDVTLEIDSSSGRSTQPMNRSGPLEHQFEFRNVTSEFRFRARGGDEVTPWVQVSLVDPPAISQLQLTARLPDYTGPREEVLPQGSGPHAVLEGSALTVRAVSNKPLRIAALQHEADEPLPLQSSDQTNFSLTIPADQLAGGKYTFVMEDLSGLTSSRPASFQLKIKPDRAPQVRASLQGISGLVIPRAVIPVAFQVKDEFAVTGVAFHLGWRGDEASSVPQERSAPIEGLPVPAEELQAQSAYDLRGLELPVGVGLRVSLQASDNNTLSGPGVGESREFLLRVVSEEELRADLLRREIEQRQAFELALKNQEQLTVDLRALSAAERESPSDPPDLRVPELMEMQRRQKIIGTNLAGIADRFEDFLIEARNNRLDESETELDESRSIERRLNDKIIVPIRELDAGEIYEASQRFDAVRRAVGDPAAFQQQAADTAALQEQIQQQMRIILSAMEDSETYQEIINQAIETKRIQEQVRKLTEQKKQENQDRDIFDDPDGLFDDENDDENDDDNRK